MQWIYIICFALISAGLLALFGVRPGDFIDALFRSQRKAANVKIAKKGKSAVKTRICPSFWPVWCRLISSKSCRKVVVVSLFYYILCRPISSDTIYCGISV